MAGIGISSVCMMCLFIHLTRLSSWNCQAYSEQLIQMQNLERINVSDIDCPTWHFYNKNNANCECYKYIGDDEGVIKCRANGATVLQYGQCMTHDKNTGATFVAKCPYFQPIGHNISEGGYITLPSNVSELNDYMCGPMNRKGPLCSECIDNFGLSATSFLYTCSNCTQFSLMYGIPLYVFSEIIPITVFYLVILIYRINLTSSPMTCFILYSQSVMNAITIDLDHPVAQIVYQPNYIRTVITALYAYGMWNLDFFKYILPPFCLSRHLKQTHVALFGYMSVVYPLCLIIVTLVCIELHGCNFRPIVWLWRPLHKIFVKLRKEWNAKSDIIDVFATFLLLSCSKVMYQSVLLAHCPSVVKTNPKTGDVSISHVGGNDLMSPCRGTRHLSFALPACFIACLVFLLVLLLILYPFKWFRNLSFFSKCGFLNRTSVTIFVEKFHSCYRNGLDEGRDMRSFSGLYFGLRIVSIFYFVTHKFISQWTYEAIPFSSAAMLVALVRPYKKTYMNVLDPLLLSLLAMICLLLSMSSKHSSIQGIEVFTISLIPAVIFRLYFAFKLIFKLWIRLRYHFRIMTLKMRTFNAATCNQQSHLLTHPTSSTVTITDVCSYGSTHS